MEYLIKQKDFLNEDIKWKFWEQDREKMELELLDAINKCKTDFKYLEENPTDNNLDKYKISLDKVYKKFKSFFEYSVKNDNIMHETLHDYLDDFLEVANKIESVDMFKEPSTMKYIDKTTELLIDLSVK